MDDPIASRIERALDAPGLVERLAALPGSELQSLLLAVHRERAAAVRPADLLRAYEDGRFARPSPVDAARLRELERRAFSLLPDGFAPVELSPVEPFGAAAALGAVPQDWVLSAARAAEVAADPTVALALEAALRRRGSGGRVDLAAAQRVVRAQPFEPPLRAHFSLVALCSAGRDPGGHAFDAEALRAHVAFYLRLADRPGLRVALTPLAGGLTPALLEERVAASLATEFPAARVELDRERQGGEPGYYVRACFRIDAGEVNIADGGFTDWSARLLGDAKERLLTSGIGTERLLD